MAKSKALRQIIDEDTPFSVTGSRQNLPGLGLVHWALDLKDSYPEPINGAGGAQPK